MQRHAGFVPLPPAELQPLSEHLQAPGTLHLQPLLPAKIGDELSTFARRLPI